LQCYGTIADIGVSAWTNAPHKIEQLPKELKNSILYRVPISLKQNEASFDIQPTKECDVYFAHSKHQDFEHSLKFFEKLEQPNKVLKIKKGSITVDLAIWRRRVNKNEEKMEEIYVSGPETINDAEVAIFVKEGMIYVCRYYFVDMYKVYYDGINSKIIVIIYF